MSRSEAFVSAAMGTVNPEAPSRGAMGIAAALLLLAAAVMIVFAPGLAGAVSLQAGVPAPDFTVQTLGGDTVSLHDYSGKVVLVMFWSSWCSRCREEIDFLRTMQERYPALAVFALNAETDKPTADDVARIEAAAKEWRMPQPVAIDEGLRVWDRYQVNALPTSMIVGADGTIVFIEPNFYWASPENFDNALRSAFETREADAPFDAAALEASTCRQTVCLLADLPR